MDTKQLNMYLTIDDNETYSTVALYEEKLTIPDLTNLK